MCPLDSGNRDRSVGERLETLHRRTAAINRVVILLDDLVELFAACQRRSDRRLAALPWPLKQSSSFRFMSLRGGRAPVRCFGGCPHQASIHEQGLTSVDSLELWNILPRFLDIPQLMLVLRA
jgi:hypothetical protein